MTHYFLDTSLFARIFLPGPTPHVLRNLDLRGRLEPRTALVVVCDIALPESVGVFQSELGKSVATVRSLVSQLIREIARIEGPYMVVRASAVMEQAARLALKHRLAGADALHLAAALQARKHLRRHGLRFGTRDRRLQEAAESEGFELYEA